MKNVATIAFFLAAIAIGWAIAWLRMTECTRVHPLWYCVLGMR